METVIHVVLDAGRAAVDVALYTLLPIMVVMMILMRVLEASGVLMRFVAIVAPLARPFGLTGLGVLAMIQITLVSFIAPVSSLSLMEDRGASNRHLAAAFAAVLAMAPANAVFPLATLGLRTGLVLALSWLGGLVAASATYWLFGRGLTATTEPITAIEGAALESHSLLKIINVSGREAIQIVINIIPMLLLSLAVVMGLQQAGAVDALVALLTPTLSRWGIDSALILPSVTKFLAGSTALVGVVHQMAGQGQISPAAINAGAGFLLHPLDLPGVAIFASTSVRLGRNCLPAIAGACVGIAVRMAGTALV